MDRRIQELRSLQRLARVWRLNQRVVCNFNFFVSSSEHLPDGMVGFKRTRDHDITDFRSSESDLHAAAKLPSFNDVMGDLKRIRRTESGLAGSSIDCPIFINDDDAHDRFLDLGTAHFRMLPAESSASCEPASGSNEESGPECHGWLED